MVCFQTKKLAMIGQVYIHRKNTCEIEDLVPLDQERKKTEEMLQKTFECRRRRKPFFFFVFRTQMYTIT